MTAGRCASAAAVSVQISCGSHGVSEIAVPLREVLLQQLQRLRVGVRRPVLAGLEAGVGADQDHRLVGLAGDGLARLGADGVQARRDVAERRHEGAVGRADAEVVAVGGDAAEDAGDGVLADAADREQARLGVGARVPEAAAGSRRRWCSRWSSRARSAAATRNAPPLACLQVLQGAAELAAQRGEGAGLEAQLERASPPAPARSARPPRRARRRRRRAGRRAWGPVRAPRGGRGRPRAAPRARPPCGSCACDLRR